MNRGKDNAPERAMWLLLVAIIATCMIMAAGTCSGQLIHRCIDVSINCQLWPSSCDHSCRRVGGPDLAREYYQVPRTVGLNIQIPDTGTYPAPWWHLTPSQPLWQTMDWVKESFDVTAIGHYLRSHPWDHTQNNENIRMAFRAPGMQIIQITPQHWGAEGTKCDADGTAREGNITWLNYPIQIFVHHFEFIFPYLKRNHFCFTRFKLYFFESFKFFNRPDNTANFIANIKLNYLCTCPFSRISNFT